MTILRCSFFHLIFFRHHRGEPHQTDSACSDSQWGPRYDHQPGFGWMQRRRWRKLICLKCTPVILEIAVAKNAKNTRFLYKDQKLLKMAQKIAKITRFCKKILKISENWLKIFVLLIKSILTSFFFFSFFRLKYVQFYLLIKNKS